MCARKVTLLALSTLAVLTGAWLLLGDEPAAATHGPGDEPETDPDGFGYDKSGDGDE